MRVINVKDYFYSIQRQRLWLLV